MSPSQSSGSDILVVDAVAATRAAAARHKWIAVLGNFVFAILPFLVLLAVWWGAWLIFDPPEIILVSPPTVFWATIHSIQDGTLPTYISRSLSRLAFGTVVAAGIGIPLGWLIGIDEDVAHSFEPFLRFFNAVSGIAWLPAMIIWFGFSERTIQVIIIYTMIFPIIFNSMTSVRTIPRRYRDACKTLGAGRMRIIRDVYMPGSFPGVMTGIRLGIGFGWRALIAGEFVVGTAAGGGIGFYIFDARTQGSIRKVMAGMIVLGMLGLVINRMILRPVEEYVNERWGAV